jgi:hypothetical protein
MNFLIKIFELLPFKNSTFLRLDVRLNWIFYYSILSIRTVAELNIFGGIIEVINKKFIWLIFKPFLLANPKFSVNPVIFPP